MTIKRRALSILLSLAVIFTFMPFVSTQAYAASKQPLVTKAVGNGGTTYTYSYNGKGLVKKIVAKNSSSDNSTDKKYSATTAIKYNKKNKISSETTTSTTSTTSYRTDNTTGKKRVENKGTVKNIDKTVTKFTYNKKGLATKSVTTTTTTKSGSTTNNRLWLELDNVDKLSDGTYRYYDYEAGEYKIITADQAAAFAKSSSSTTAYKNNGGSYTRTTTYSNPEFKPETTTYTDKSVTTTTFKYKKKNVKSAKATTVETEESSGTRDSGTVWKTSTVTTHSPVTTTYSYKKGRVVKETTKDPNTYTKVTTNTSTAADGTVTVTTTTWDAYDNMTRVVTVNGVETSRTTEQGKTNVYATTDTTSYKYDKNGNLKSSKGKATEKEDNYTEDETYYTGDSYWDPISVVFFNAAGEREYVKTPVSTVYKWSTSFQNTVKKGTKKLLTIVGMSKSSTDGRASGNKGSYSMNRTKYTLKSKKYAKKASANVEAQQWMIQNGVFLVAGLR